MSNEKPEDLSGAFNAAQLPLLDGMADALARKDLKAVRALLEQGAAVDQADENGNTALILGVIYGDLAFIQLLIDNDADIDKASENAGKVTPLMLAVANERADVVRLLLYAGADFSKVNGSGNTALNWAEDGGNAEITQMLRDAAEGILPFVANLAEEKARHDAVASQQETLKDIARRKKLNIRKEP